MSTLEFNQLLVSTRPVMRGFAISFTRNVEDAEDLIQDTFLKAMRYKDHFAEGTNFKGWLYTIMRNVFLNNCKKQQLGRGIFQHNVTHETIAPSSSHADNNILRGINIKDIKAAINDLKEDIRIPFEMAFEGYHYDEISAKMGVPTGTIKSRIFNARKILMNRLKEFN